MAGGRRSGAGRKPGSGKYGVPTKSIRVPVFMVEDIERYIYNRLLNIYTSANIEALRNAVEENVPTAQEASQKNGDQEESPQERA